MSYGETGTLGEAADGEKDTYLSVFKRVFDEQLAAFGKSVVSVRDKGEEDQIFRCSTTICFRRTHEPTTNRTKGRVYFLDTGLLFLSQKLRLYLPFESLAETLVVLVRDEALSPVNPPVSLEVHTKTTEPYHKTKSVSEPNTHGGDQDPMLISFKEMPVDLLDKVKAYASKHGINFKECEQLYYDFAKNLPMTGWNPVKKKSTTPK
ncbi:hypothetical protein MMC11_000897 [Xylographa trunciseda]|nr:hypothetical protein [Xylographa trunciseda]